MKKIKQESKYISSEFIKEMYSELTSSNRVILKILHKTGIRISEVKEYVDKMLWDCYKPQPGVDDSFDELLQSPIYKPTNKSISLKPAKRNWNRLIPVVINHYEYKQLHKISLESSALQKRIRSWDYGISPHDFRATFITNALGLDLNPIKIQRIMGHKELSSTLKYNRLNTEHDLWMYDYITAEPKEWTTSSDVAFLKQQVKMYSEQNAKLKYKLEGKK